MKALIIDDEAMPAKYLATLLKRNFPQFNKIGIGMGATEGIEKLNSMEYDVLFLDIEMPKMTGFQLLDEVFLPENTKVIFTTAFENYAIEAFKVNALDYLLKPVTELDLHKVINRINNSTIAKKKTNLITVFCDNEHIVLSAEDIVRMEADGSYTKVITEKEVYLSSKNLKTNSSKLDQDKFYRCHNSHIVNISKIDRIGKGKNSYIALKNKEIVPVSSSRHDGLNNLIGI